MTDYKINCFSPLPPAHTEIAHYSARIMKSLAHWFGVVLGPDLEEWDESIAEMSLNEIRSRVEMELWRNSVERRRLTENESVGAN